jgi:hypothetical protein
MEEVMIFAAIAIAFLISNGGMIYAAWRICSTLCPRAKKLP